METLMNILREIDDSIDYEKEQALIDDRLLDSFGVITLVAELEDAFDISIEASEMVPENFNSARGNLQNGLQTAGELNNVLRFIIIYSFVPPGMSGSLPACAERLAQAGAAGIRLRILLSVQRKAVGIPSGNYAAGPLYRHLAGVAEIGGKSCRRRSFGERAEGGKSVISETEQTGASAGNCTSAGRTGISEIL